MTVGFLDGIAGLGSAFAERDDRDPDAFPVENLEDLKRSGLLLAPLPASLGGRGSDLVEMVRATEIIASASASTALLTTMPLGLAGIYASGAQIAPDAHRDAWSAQIDEVAAAYRAGKWYAACNSEKGAGGSLASTKTFAERQSDGNFALTGEKILASSGRFADYFFSTAKVPPEQLPGCGIVEFFILKVGAEGMEILSDWDGFGMRSTESHTVRLKGVVADAVMGFPNFIEVVKPLQYWFCLFAAIPLGCAAGMLAALATPAPESPALRMRFTDALMRIEAMRAYLLETASNWRPGAPAPYQLRVLRTKTYVTQEATRLCAEMFALAGGRHYVRSGRVSRALADSFAGTALRPPLPLALDMLVEQFTL